MTERKIQSSIQRYESFASSSNRNGSGDSSYNSASRNGRPETQSPLQPTTWINYRNGLLTNAQASTPQIPVPAPIRVVEEPIRQPVPSTPSAAPTLGALLVVLSSNFNGKVLEHVETLLHRSSFDTVALIGQDETLTKQTKIEIFGLAGRLQKNISVDTYTVDLGETQRFSKILKDVNSSGPIVGVLYYVEFVNAGRIETGMVDILDLDMEEMSRAWRSSVLALQVLAASTIPTMRTPSSNGGYESSTEDTESPQQDQPFFLVSFSSASGDNMADINRVACENVLDSIRRTHSHHGIDIGYTEKTLFSKAAPRPAKQPQLAIQTNEYSLERSTEAVSPMQESPTRLWEMWASQNE
ncbi:hypothetical protein LTR66_007005 [Elasticomyces elasticus]|nr:hypothetical protein LTR66_007005 [Elasticomyces elasticus]